MKGKFDAYLLCPLAKKFQNWIVDWSTARDFTVLGWAFNFTSFLNLIFGSFLQFGPLWSAAIRKRTSEAKNRGRPPWSRASAGATAAAAPATWSLSMLQLERGAVTLCSVCALLRNFDKDLHGDPMLLWLLLEVVTACGVTCCIFDGNAKSQRKKAEA